MRPLRASSRRPCPAPPPRALRTGRPAVVPAVGAARAFWKPRGLRGRGRARGRGARAPSAPPAASCWENAERRGWCAAGGPAGTGAGAGRAGGPHGGWRPALPPVLAAKYLPSEWRREDPGRDTAATVLVSPRRSSGGERHAGKMLEVLVLKVSERLVLAGRPPSPRAGAAPAGHATRGFGPTGGLARWDPGPPNADPQHEISVQVCPCIIWDTVKSYKLFVRNSCFYELCSIRGEDRP